MAKLKKRRQKHMEHKPKKQPSKLFSAQSIWAIGIIAIMVLSVAGFLGANDSGPNAIEYNGFVFTPGNDGLYTTLLDETQVSFHYLPTSISEFPIDATIIDRIQNADMIITTFTYDDNNNELFDQARFELADKLSLRNTYVASGITEPHSAYALPQLTCANATPEIPVLLLQASNASDITMDGNCIMLRAEDQNIVIIYERLLYGVLGII